MSREIKVRRSHFIDEECTVFHHNDFWGTHVGIHGAKFTSPSQNNTALYFIDDQFIGIKDKNGVEIYTGCLIKIHAGHPCNIKQTFTVVFMCGAFCLKESTETLIGTSTIKDYAHTCFEHNLILDIDDVGDMLEVIGTIYDNTKSLI